LAVTRHTCIAVRSGMATCTCMPDDPAQQSVDMLQHPECSAGRGGAHSRPGIVQSAARRGAARRAWCSKMRCAWRLTLQHSSMQYTMHAARCSGGWSGAAQQGRLGAVQRSTAQCSAVRRGAVRCDAAWHPPVTHRRVTQQVAPMPRHESAHAGWAVGLCDGLVPHITSQQRHASSPRTPSCRHQIVQGGDIVRVCLHVVVFTGTNI
jgi:hypothetical protein